MHRIVAAIDAFSEKSGQVLAILPLALVLVQFAVVLMVYVFASGSIQLQESLQYINAVMFLGGAGYTAVRGEHVRVDIFYSKFSERGKAVVNLLGTLLLLIPFLILFWMSAVPSCSIAGQLAKPAWKQAGCLTSISSRPRFCCSRSRSACMRSRISCVTPPS
ncbi:TRAP transporter small permease subunit [Kordiimonas gwangyangensis]|uniref:TRAP transporter small permease subunit n=1 Tax=Kordiimonas gwangyangensis TaxID=288022 RepID=UPI0006859D87|nr:TRAP transporter small permease subunit [Kordiimonas gwangyangensis]